MLLKKKNIWLLAFIFSLFYFSGCRKGPSYWDDDFVAPIAHGGLSLGNLFPDSTIKSNSDSSLKIAFESTLINYQLDSLLQMPETTLTTSFIFNYGVDSTSLTPGMNIPLSTNSVTPNYYNLPNGVQLKKAIIKQGGISFVMHNTVYKKLIYRYQLLSATKNYKILDTTFKIPKAISASQPGILSGYIDLSGYTIDFTGTNHNEYNVTEEIDSVHIDPNETPGYLYNNQGFTATFQFKSITPQYALGYFGNQIINVGPDTTAFAIFNTIKSGILNLNSAKIDLRIVNEFGVSMKASINYLSSISTANSKTVTINGSNSTPLQTPIIVNAALNTGTGATALTKTISINTTNTPTLTTFIGILPNKFAYKLSTQINPYGNLSLGNDFGYYGTAFKALMDVDIPLYFSASNLILGDTVKFNLSGVNQLQNINRGQLILTAVNGYPFSINLQAYLLDDTKHVMDSLFLAPNTINAPALDGNYKVVAPVQSKLFVPLTKDKIAKVQKAKYIYYKAKFNTVGQPTQQIKFYNYYNLDLLLTADVNYTIGK
jgi:hypothetical protein